MPLKRRQIAWRAAQDLADGAYVNLGIGLPTLVSDFIPADRGDRWGNLTYRKSARNFNPTMATAADLSIVQVRRIVELGDLDPEMIVTPGIFIDRIVHVAL